MSVTTPGDRWGHFSIEVLSSYVTQSFVKLTNDYPAQRFYLRKQTDKTNAVGRNLQENSGTGNEYY